MLNEYQINQIIEIIVHGYDPLKIFLFGSYTSNTADSNSDLDLLIIKNTQETYYQRSRTIRRLFKPIPCAMDIAVYTPDEFISTISQLNSLTFIVTKTGKVVYERPV